MSKPKNMQEYDGYKIPLPRHFSKEEIEILEKEKEEKIKKIILENPHLTTQE